MNVLIQPNFVQPERHPGEHREVRGPEVPETPGQRDRHRRSRNTPGMPGGRRTGNRPQLAEGRTATDQYARVSGESVPTEERKIYCHF